MAHKVKTAVKTAMQFAIPGSIWKSPSGERYRVVRQPQSVGALQKFALLRELTSYLVTIDQPAGALEHSMRIRRLKPLAGEITIARPPRVRGVS